MTAAGHSGRENHQDLVTAYGIAAVQEVLAEAAERQELDHMGYARRVLPERYAERGDTRRAKEPAIPERLLCDLCGLPSWTNAMVVRNGLGVCTERGCADADVPPPPGTAWQTREHLTWEDLQAIPGRRRRLVVSERTPAEAEWRERYNAAYRRYLAGLDDEMARRFPDALRTMRERGLLVALAEIADLEATKRWREETQALGLCPLSSPRQHQYTVDVWDEPEPTPTARLVAAYWGRVGGVSAS